MTESMTISVNVPTLVEFSRKYKQYGNFARGEGRFLFDLITEPGNFIRMLVTTLDFGLPAVAGIARICFETANQNPAVEWNDHLKQYIGAVACSVMEANGFNKTGTKRAIPHPRFTKGEVYQIGPGIISSNWLG